MLLPRTEAEGHTDCSLARPGYTPFPNDPPTLADMEALRAKQND